MPGDSSIDLVVETTRGSRTFTFDKTAKVAEVIATAVREFEFVAGDRFELVLRDNPAEALKPERTLVSYHLTDGTVVILTAIGTGV